MGNEECDQHVLSFSLSFSVYKVVFMMLLFAIFIVVQMYPDLLNTYAPIKHDVMHKYPKSAYRITIRNGSYFPEPVLFNGKHKYCDSFWLFKSETVVY